MKRKTIKTPLELLTEKSQNAINLVLSTIENLKDTNKAISDEYQKNNDLIASIQSTNSSLDDLKNGNEKIISNFEKLLQ
jgi:FtsZ-binding cell division protein ZapB